MKQFLMDIWRLMEGDIEARVIVIFGLAIPIAYIWYKIDEWWKDHKWKGER